MISLIIFACGSSKSKVDLLLFNAKVYTVDKDFSITDCIVIDSGKIVETGSKDKMLAKYNATESIDLSGKYVYPGLIDAHCHFYNYAVDQLQANITGTRSFDEVLSLLDKFQTTNKSKWLLGRGWDQNDWDLKEFPDNKKLDSLFPDIPVFITRIDGHAALVNSAALKLAGINTDTKVEGGKIIIKNGKLTGILIDNAIDCVSKFIPKPSESEKINALKAASLKCFAVGLTSIGDAGLNKDIILLIDSLQKSGDLKMKVYAMLTANKENFEAFVYKGIYKTPFLNIRSVKLYADGALGSRGACLLKPYSDQPDNYGIMVTKPDSIKEICAMAFKYGYQVNTHAIGDSAMRVVLDIYGSFLKNKNDLRWRIEHSQVVSPDDISKFGKYSIIPSVNTVHATSDMYWAEMRLGTDRVKFAYAYKNLLEQNKWLCNGSDFPVENINPIYGFYAAVVRRDLKGYPDKGFQTENALSRIEALKAMTIWAAKSFFEENEKGSIESGKYADFVILDRDIMTVDEKEIPLAKVLMTFINGKKVYDFN
jgi:hypothetical protein